MTKDAVISEREVVLGSMTGIDYVYLESSLSQKLRDRDGSLTKNPRRVKITISYREEDLSL